MASRPALAAPADSQASAMSDGIRESMRTLLAAGREEGSDLVSPPFNVLPPGKNGS